jgi:hypothetical protein
MKHVPIVHGGQGRTARSLRSDSGNLAWLIFVLGALVMTLVFG